MKMIDYRVYLVTDDPSRYKRNWLETIAAALDGGVTCVQYRDTENPEQIQYERILKLQDLLKPRHIPLIVNNNAHLAAAVKAEGVHVGQGDMPPAQVRQIVGPACEIGLSITSTADIDSMKGQGSRSRLRPQVEIAEAERRPTSTKEVRLPSSTSTSNLNLVDCLGIGPVFDARKTKADASTAIGTDGLKAIIARVPDFPNCAIGGITTENAADVLAAGAKGLAIVSALSQAPDPTLAARTFANLFN